MRASITVDDGRQFSALLSASLTLCVVEAEAVSSTLNTVDVLDGAATCAVHSRVGRWADTLRVGLAIECVQVAAVRAADLSNRVPESIVERITETVIAGGITNFGYCDTLLSSRSREVTENATLIHFAFAEEARFTLGDTNHVGGIPVAAGIVDALSLRRNSLAARLAYLVGEVPRAAANESGRLASGHVLGGSTACLAAGAVCSEPLADTRVHVALCVGSHQIASLLAHDLIGVPDAARISFTGSLVRVGGITSAFANVVAPQAESVQRTVLFGSEHLARSFAGSRVDIPFAHRRGSSTIGLRSVLELALELTLVVSDVPSAHGVGQTGTAVRKEGTVSCAAESGSIPEATWIVVTLLLSRISVNTTHSTGSIVVGSEVAHRVRPAEITNLRPNDGWILL